MNGLLQSALFQNFKMWSKIDFSAAVTSKLLKFEVQDGDKTHPLYLATVISREEKITWQSFEDLLDHTVKLAQAGMRGIFGLDVLLPDTGPGIRNFNPYDLSRLITNHAKELAGGAKNLIRYGQVFCILHNRAPADWGKIDLATHVEIVDPEKTKLESYLKKMARESSGGPDAIYVVQDLSTSQVWNPAIKTALDAYIFKTFQQTIHKISL